MTDNEWGAQEMYLQVTNDPNLYAYYLVEIHRINNCVCISRLPGRTENEPPRPLTREERLRDVRWLLCQDLGDYKTSGRKPKPRIVLMEGMGHGKEAYRIASERIYDYFSEELKYINMDEFHWNPYLAYKREYED